MPLFTSSSERPTIGSLAAAVVLGALVLGVGISVIRSVGGRAINPMISAITLHPESYPQVVIVGNSVTQSALSSAQVASAAGLQASEVALVAAGGLQPVHWLAVVRHQILARGHTPSVIIVYAPAHMLGRVRLTAELDQALLLDLLDRPDPSLVGRATGGAGGWWALWSRDRQRTRDSALRLIGHGPAELWYGRGRDEPIVEPAMADLFSGRGPAGAGADVMGLGLDDRTDDAVRERQEETVPLAESWIPVLSKEAKQHNARPMVVLAAEKGARCDPHDTVVEELVALGIDVLDLRVTPLGAAAFSGIHHLNPPGTTEVSERVGSALAALPTDITAPAEGRVVGCPSDNAAHERPR